MCLIPIAMTKMVGSPLSWMARDLVCFCQKKKKKKRINSSQHNVFLLSFDPFAFQWTESASDHSASTSLANPGQHGLPPVLRAKWKVSASLTCVELLASGEKSLPES